MGFDDFAVSMTRVSYSSRDRVISEHLHELIDHPNSYYHLLSVANVYWLDRNWLKVIEYAKSASALRPNSFRATKMLVSAYGEMGQVEECFRYARHLITLSLPSWRMARVLGYLLKLFAVIPRGRMFHQRWTEQWKTEEASDHAMLEFSVGFISKYEIISESA